MISKIINMAEKIKDAEDRMLDLPPTGLSGTVRQRLPIDPRRYLGRPYCAKRWNCYTLVRTVLADAYDVQLPAYDATQEAYEAATVERVRGRWQKVCGFEAQQRFPLGYPGDVGAFQIALPAAKGGLTNHVGILVEPGRFLHVMEGGGTWVASLQDPDWKRRMLAVYRHPELAQPA